jgi:hypothetical protein
MPDRTPLYSHRLNRDGSYDSICHLCFATVGTGKTEEELVVAETGHLCDPATLYQKYAEKWPDPDQRTFQTT